MAPVARHDRSSACRKSLTLNYTNRTASWRARVEVNADAFVRLAAIASPGERGPTGPAPTGEVRRRVPARPGLEAGKCPAGEEVCRVGPDADGKTRQSRGA